MRMTDRVRANVDELSDALAAFLSRDVIRGECHLCSPVADAPRAGE